MDSDKPSRGFQNNGSHRALQSALFTSANELNRQIRSAEAFHPKWKTRPATAKDATAVAMLREREPVAGPVPMAAHPLAAALSRASAAVTQKSTVEAKRTGERGGGGKIESRKSGVCGAGLNVDKYGRHVRLRDTH